MNFKKNKKVLQYPRILELNDDFSLIKRFIEGDESTFRLLVQRHKEKVRNIIYLNLNSTSSVDDIAQDVFITVYKNLRKFRFESQFTTWLYRITINKCKDHLRKIRIRSLFIPVKDMTEEPVYNTSAENIELKEAVHKAVARLPEKLRIPLMLKDFEGFSYQEIADTVQCEIGTVKSRIFRAREGLKNILKPYQEDFRT